MPKRWSKTEAFEHFGAKCANSRWSWSARSARGDVVVLTMWTDGFVDFKADPIVYDDTGWTTADVTDQLGNKERMANIRHAIDRLDGVVRVVMARARDRTAEPREIDECWPKPELVMKITHFNEATGEWRAESVKQPITVPRMP